VRLEVDDLAAPRHEGHRARQRPGVNLPLHRVPDPRQPLARHADIFRLARADRSRSCPERQCECGECGNDKKRLLNIHARCLLGLPAEALAKAGVS